MAAGVENEQGYIEDGEMGPELAPFPAYVQSAEDRRRWNAAYDIAVNASALHEESGEPDPRATWYGTRALYSSDFPTGAGDAPLRESAETIDETDGVPVDGQGFQVSARDRATELIAAAYAAAEHGDARSAEQFSVEALDVLFGDPDGLPDLPGRVEESDLEEFGAYDEAKHPRGRAGKWAAGLGKIKDAVRSKQLDAHAAVTLKKHVARSTWKGGVLHGDVRKLSKEARLHRDAAVIAERTGAKPEHVQARINHHLAAAHAQEERNRSTVKGAVQQHGLRGGEIAAGSALAHVHKVMTHENPLDSAADRLERKGGRRNEALAVGAEAISYAFPDPREAFAGHTPAQGEDVRGEIEQGHEWAVKAIDMARWAHEHENHLRVIGHVLKHAAGAVGISAARHGDE